MSKELERLNKIYPNGKYVVIAKYNPELFKDKEYDSSFDVKSTETRWKSKPLTFEQAKKYSEEGYRLGWVIPKGMVVVDIDNKDNHESQERIEKLLQKFEVAYSYNYTSKGIHILFKDPSEKIRTDSRKKCGLNIEIDCRANETGYIVLPENDPHREWGKWSDFVENIPYFLVPLMKESSPSFIGMKDGDGRNDVLFRWRSRLEACNKLTKEQIEKCIRIINEYLFDTPLPNNELCKTVLREKDKKGRENPTEKDNPYNQIAEDIVGKFDIVSRGDYFYKFNGIYYKPLELVELEQLIHYEVSKNLSKAARNEIIQFLKLKTQVPLDDFDREWHKIACKNGIINLVTGELITPTKNDINTIYVPYDYNIDPVYSPKINEFMKDLCNGDPIKMQFLYQVAGYCLLKKNFFGKFFIFKGEGGTGKSTFTNLIMQMIGTANCSHVALADFDRDYHLATIMGKLANIDDDVVDNKALEYTGKFKSLITGEIISVRQIYREVVSFIPYVTCLFSCNRLPKIMDKTSGLYRRLILIELNHKVAKPDPLFMQKITTTDMQYFLFKAVEGIKLALEEGHFRISQSEQDLIEMFKRRQSALNEWLYETDITLGDLVNKRCLPLYQQFSQWCEQNGYNKKITNYVFKEDICSLYDLYIDSETPDVPVQVFKKKGEYKSNWKPF